MASRQVVEPDADGRSGSARPTGWHSVGGVDWPPECVIEPGLSPAWQPRLQRPQVLKVVVQGDDRGFRGRPWGAA